MINFNSRPYTRGDERLPIRQISRSDFNSRPYTRGDGNSQESVGSGQSGCAWRARGGRRLAVMGVKRNFNSRPYTRGDNPSFECCTLAYNFNSRPYTRGDETLIPRLV